jgi:hypothetical protein
MNKSKVIEEIGRFQRQGIRQPDDVDAFEIALAHGLNHKQAKRIMDKAVASGEFEMAFVYDENRGSCLNVIRKKE